MEQHKINTTKRLSGPQDSSQTVPDHYRTTKTQSPTVSPPGTRTPRTCLDPTYLPFVRSPVLLKSKTFQDLFFVLFHYMAPLRSLSISMPRVPPLSTRLQTFLSSASTFLDVFFQGPPPSRFTFPGLLPGQDHTSPTSRTSYRRLVLSVTTPPSLIVLTPEHTEQSPGLTLESYLS